MNASVLLRGARSRSGLSQRELARRAGMRQPAVSRIERGVVSPTVDTLDRLLSQCGRELEAAERPSYDVDRTLIRERLRLTPGERVRLAELEWRRTQPFRRAAARARQR
ncbi:MAG TPA: helix-turn-helix transcriptional regulator [Actinomycetota bacterium]